MPTVDPVKRRRQNCENQKRWRQRQVDELRRLSTELEKSEHRVHQLDAESSKLREALQDALDEVKHLRKVNRTLQIRTRPASKQKPKSISGDAGDPSKAEPEGISATSSGDNRQTFDSIYPDGITPIPNGTNVQSIDRFVTRRPLADPIVSAFRSGFRKLSSETDGLHHDDPDWESIVITDDEEDQEDDEAEADTSHPRDHLVDCPDPLKPPVRPEIDLPGDNATTYSAFSSAGIFPSYAEDNAQPDDAVYAALGASAVPLPDPGAESSSSLELAQMSHTSPNPNMLNWSIASTLGNSDILRQRVMEFPSITRISKHISVVQNVLYGSLGQIAARPMIEREKIVAEAFAWIVRESWPSSEAVLKMMTVYRHIFTFELWRSFPCKATYNKMHPLYRPTPLQLLVPHSPAIDWLPWPSMRDKAIQLQDQVDVDQICMIALENTVIEPYFSYDPSCSTDTSFRIWDMYLMEKAGGGLVSSTGMTHDPVSPNVQALVKTYNIPFQDVAHLRVDAPFCAMFPQMYLPECASRYQTAPLDVEYRERLHYPDDLSAAAVARLQKQVQEMLLARLHPAGGT